MKTRKTKQKARIALAMQTLNHPTAEEVCAELCAHCGKSSVATVYRNLSTMVEQGELKRISATGKVDRFDIHTHHHYHFACTSCGGLFDVDLPYLPDLDMHAASLGFSVDEHSLLFTGKCSECQTTKH